MSDRPLPLRRRTVLLGIGASVALAGCQSGDRPAPVTISADQSCDQCGMVISQHPGPVGQTYYENNDPETHDPPFQFCSTTCTFRHRFAHQDWTPRVTYLTDYSTVDYDVRQDGERTVISAHLEAETFTPTEQLSVVVGADVQGAMGPALVPFAEQDDADAFAEEYGGDRIAAESISRELVGTM